MLLAMAFARSYAVLLFYNRHFRNELESATKGTSVAVQAVVRKSLGQRIQFDFSTLKKSR